MYGLVIEAIAQHIIQTHGDDVWQEVKKKTGITNQSFHIHKTYRYGARRSHVIASEITVI